MRAARFSTELKLEDGTFLTDDFLRQLINVGEVDILVGVPTHNNAKTIGSIVQAIQSGILRVFPENGQSSSMPMEDHGTARQNW